MSKLTKQAFQWHINGKILLFSAIFFPLTLSLGFWQLDRAEQKKQLLSMYNARQQASSVVFESVNHDSDRQYFRVQVLGKWRVTPTLLLDNRVRRGKPGYEVINILDTSLGALLVNRGWIEGSLNRNRLPPLMAMPEQSDVELTGYLYKSPGKQVMLGEDNWDTEAAVVIIQNAAPDVVGQRLGESPYSYSLRLDQRFSELDASWVVVGIQPGKHIGYAVQWFAMAFALVGLTLFANSNLSVWIKSRREK